MSLSGFRAALSRAMPEPPPLLPLRPDELRAGDTLPFDLYDAEGRRLLPRGTPVVDDAQAARLLERGASADGALLSSSRAAADEPAAMPSPRIHRVRPWSRLLALRDALESALPGIAAGGAGAAGALDAVLASGAELQRLCALDADAMLAVPMLLDGGRYGTRHGIASAVVLEFMLTRLGAPPAERRSAVRAALTMNVGMLALQEALYAHAGPLSDEQRAEVLAHPQVGVGLLRAAGVGDEAWLAVVAQHHEHLDGSGYPGRASGPGLRADAQALMVAERWCAMVAPRAYRPGAPPDQALRLLRGRLDGVADPAIARALTELVGPLPPGTAVRLASGEIGLVFRRTRDASAPVVLAFRSAAGRPHPDGVRRTGGEPRTRIESCVAHEALGCRVDPERLWEAVEVAEPEPSAGATG